MALAEILNYLNNSNDSGSKSQFSTSICARSGLLNKYLNFNMIALLDVRFLPFIKSLSILSFAVTPHLGKYFCCCIALHQKPHLHQSNLLPFKMKTIPTCLSILCPQVKMINSSLQLPAIRIPEKM